MKILVTGGAGFIGSSVIRRAIAQGHRVVNLDALINSENHDTFREFEGDPAYTFIKADIRDRETLDRVFAETTPESVMHLAAESHVDRSIDLPAEFVQTNIVGTFNLLEAARTYCRSTGELNKFRFHHVSTDEVFGSAASNEKFRETTPYRPRNPYSASKAASDHLVRSWAETFALPVVVTNSSNNYGPFQTPDKLIPKVILCAMAGKPIPVYGKGENVRDWLYVEDHAEALLTVLERGEDGRSYNIGGDNELSNIDIVRRICSLLDALHPTSAPHDRQIVFVEDRPGHDLRYAMDGSRIAKELGWQPTTDFDVGLRQTVEWYLRNEDWIRNQEQRLPIETRLGLAG